MLPPQGDTLNYRNDQPDRKQQWTGRATQIVPPHGFSGFSHHAILVCADVTLFCDAWEARRLSLRG